MAQKPIPTLTAITVLEAKAALDEEWTNMQEPPAWDESKVTSKAEVIRRATLEGKTILCGRIGGLVSSQEFRMGEKVS